MRRGTRKEAQYVNQLVNLGMNRAYAEDVAAFEFQTRKNTLSCPNCDHTMHRVNDGIPSTFWCPNCGTLKTDEKFPTTSTPTIVSRATALYKQMEDVAVGDREAEPVLRALRETLPIDRIKRMREKLTK